MEKETGVNKTVLEIVQDYCKEYDSDCTEIMAKYYTDNFADTKVLEYKVENKCINIKIEDLNEPEGAMLLILTFN